LLNQSNADIIHDLVGQVQMQPVMITMESPSAVTNVNGMIHVVGSHNGRAAREIVNISTRSSMGIEYFDSLASAAGGTGNTAGRIREVRQLNNGSVLYVGNSAGSSDTSQPTSWLTPNNPQGGAGTTGFPSSGEYYGLSKAGLIVGTVDNAITATHGNLPQLLPGNGVVGLDITSSGSHIAGSLLWEANNFGGYDILNTSGFDFSVSGGLPTWQAVAIDPVTGEAVFAGEYLNSSSFENEVGFWREDGSFDFSTGAGTEFTDFEIYSGQLVAAVNGYDDTSLWAITDASSLYMESILGSKSLLAENGLFQGSVGFLGQSASGNVFVATASAVPEPGSFALLAIGMTCCLMRRRRGRATGVGSCN